MKIEATTNEEGERVLSLKCEACPAMISFVVKTDAEDRIARGHMTDAYRRHACKGQS